RQCKQAGAGERVLDAAREGGRSDDLMKRDRQHELSVRLHDPEAMPGQLARDAMVTEDTIRLDVPSQLHCEFSPCRFNRRHAAARGIIEHESRARYAAQFGETCAPVRY